MKSLVNFIKENLFGYPNERHLYEMATIAKDVIFDKEHKSVQIHGINSGDRENPHIHIYNYGDKNSFNFEVSLVDLLCYDELKLIKMKDKKNHIEYNNRNKCTWNGYTKLRNDFEDWLYKKSNFPGDFKDNLDAIIWNYNNESYGENPILKYISDRGMKIHKNYKKYFSEQELKKYKC